VCIGTHALLTEDVVYHRLGLVVTDEQHRFGVNQRSALGQKAENPHMLVLSATPIPRTLALVIYGDLDVSVIDELPPGRQKVDTFAVGEKYRARINAFLRKQVEEGHQVFIVCPLVGDADTIPDERKAVTAYAEKLRQEVFPDLRISVLHGKMKAKEKESVMAAFAAGESDILVSTTVVEVGVDVPNANTMVVENAERFGLSQLHQLRGRVGRGSAKSYCILLSDNDSEETRRRLKVMTQTNDGFKISEEDLRLRGPGDFFGARQHGLPSLKVADLSCDMRLLDEAQNAAKALMADDPDLTAPEHRQLRARIEELFALHAESLN
jgi:ATP-dependent DNA helicase RecG